MELDQPRRKATAPALHVDAAGDTAVTDGISRARISVASICDSFDSRAEVALVWLFVERIAPLERTFAGFQYPCRVKRRCLGLCADVIQHHEQDKLDVARLGSRLAVYKAVNNERSCVDIPSLAFFDAGLFWHERREGGLGRAVCVVYQIAVAVMRGLLTD